METHPGFCSKATQHLPPHSPWLPGPALTGQTRTVCSSQSPIRLLAYRASCSSRLSWSSWPDGSPCWKPSSGQVMAGWAGRGSPSRKGLGRAWACRRHLAVLGLASGHSFFILPSIQQMVIGTEKALVTSAPGKEHLLCVRHLLALAPTHQTPSWSLGGWGLRGALALEPKARYPKARYPMVEFPGTRENTNVSGSDPHGSGG